MPRKQAKRKTTSATTSGGEKKKWKTPENVSPPQEERKLENTSESGTAVEGKASRIKYRAKQRPWRSAVTRGGDKHSFVNNSPKVGGASEERRSPREGSCLLFLSTKGGIG